MICLFIYKAAAASAPVALRCGCFRYKSGLRACYHPRDDAQHAAGLGVGSQKKDVNSLQISFAILKTEMLRHHGQLVTACPASNG
jgi:hypothetical protein